MAIFQAEAIHALEFFHRLYGAPSGAPKSRREDWGGRSGLSAGWRSDGLFFHISPRKEREALYLNLCFLEEVSRLVFPRLQTLRHPDLKFSLEAIHVSLGHGTSRLPYLWAFDIEWIEGDAGGMTTGGMAFPDQAPFYGIFFLGTLQCGALMARHHPTVDELNDAVVSLVQRIARQAAEPGGGDLAAETENFFRREVAGRGEAWSEPEEILYWRAFQLGVDLLAAGIAGDCPSRDSFFERLEALKGDVWNGLFEIGPPSEGVSKREDDAAIHAVLTGLMARWRQESGPPAYPRPGEGLPVAGDDGGVPPTVVLGSMPSPEGEELKETVVLGAKPPPGEEALDETVVLGTLPPDEPEDMDDTVALGARGNGMSGPPGGTQASKADDVPETVVLYPGGNSRFAPRAGRRETPGPPPEPPAADDDLPETVVAGKKGALIGRKPPEAEPEADDDIVFETVIIRPGERHDHHRGE